MNFDNYKPRILLNSHNITENYTQFIQRKDLNIDIRSIFKIGVEDAADILTEYDVIVLDFIVPTEVIDERIVELSNFINNKDKMLIYIIRRYSQPHDTSNTAFISTFLSRFGISNSIFKLFSAGSNYILSDLAKSSPFYHYLNASKKLWATSFDKKHSNSIEPLAINTDDDSIAFSLKHFTSNTFFLPWLDENEIEFWETIKDLAFGVSKKQEPIAEWVNNYTFDKLNNVTKQIDILKNEIEKLELRKNEFEIEKNDFLLIRDTLLYRYGMTLQNIVKKVLIFLGLGAKDGYNSREDITFVYNSNHFVLEVKGLTKSAGEKDITQLHGKKVQYETENKLKSKGVLIVNAWREIPIEERGTNDKPIFPTQMMSLVNIWEISLLTTQQLFVAYCEYLNGTFVLEDFIDMIQKTTGIIKGYDDIEKYKINTDTK